MQLPGDRVAPYGYRLTPLKRQDTIGGQTCNYQERGVPTLEGRTNTVTRRQAVTIRGTDYATKETVLHHLADRLRPPPGSRVPPHEKD